MSADLFCVSGWSEDDMTLQRSVNTSLKSASGGSSIIGIIATSLLPSRTRWTQLSGVSSANLSMIPGLRSWNWSALMVTRADPTMIGEQTLTTDFRLSLFRWNLSCSIAISSTSFRASPWNFSPSSLSRTDLASRTNNRICNLSSSLLIRLLTDGCDLPTSFAAPLKLAHSETAKNTCKSWMLISNWRKCICSNFPWRPFYRKLNARMQNRRCPLFLIEEIRLYSLIIIDLTGV